MLSPGRQEGTFRTSDGEVVWTGAESLLSVEDVLCLRRTSLSVVKRGRCWGRGREPVKDVIVYSRTAGAQNKAGQVMPSRETLSLG